MDGYRSAPAAQKFKDLDDADKNRLISFLLTLRTPEMPNADVLGIPGKPNADKLESSRSRRDFR